MRRTIIAAALASLTTLAASAAMAQMPAPAEIIKAWDKNADGGVDKAEWVAAGRPENRFAMVDTDKDGKISAEELTTAMARMRANRPQGEGGAPPAPPAEPKN
jgi:Tfp pilus assembly protein FimT